MQAKLQVDKLCKKLFRVNFLPEGQLMYHPQPIDLSNIIPEAEFEGVFECYSLKYIELYDIPEAQSIIRGSV